LGLRLEHGKRARDKPSESGVTPSGDANAPKAQLKFRRAYPGRNRARVSPGARPEKKKRAYEKKKRFFPPGDPLLSLPPKIT